MIPVDDEITLVNGHKIFPDLYTVNGIDMQTNKNIPFFTQIETDSSVSLFTHVYLNGERQSQQIYVFDGSKLKLLTTFIFYGHIYSAQLIGQKMLKVSTISTNKQSSQLFKKQVEAVYETSIYDIETSAKKYTYKSKTMHKFHFLSNNTILLYEKNKIHLYTLMNTFVFKYFLKPFQQNLVISTKILDCQCFDDKFVLIHNVIKQQQTITLVEYYQYDKQKQKIINICKLSIQLHQDNDNTIKFNHQFNSKYNPVSVIFQLKMCYVINYTKREILYFELPENNILAFDISENDYQGEQSTNVIGEFKFTQYLDYQIRRWQVIYHSGYIQLINQDIFQDKLQIIDINLNRFHKTVVLSSSVQNMLSYDNQELLDVIDGITYFYASQQNICEPSRTVTDAIQQFMLWIAAQYRDYQLDLQNNTFQSKKQVVSPTFQQNKKIKYFPFNQKNRNLFDHVPQSFFQMFTQQRMKNNSVDQIINGEQIMLNLNQQKKITYEHLMQFKQRFAQRILDFHKQQQQNAEESSCIQQLIDLSPSKSGHLHASQSNHSFAYRNRNIISHNIKHTKPVLSYNQLGNASSEYSSYKVTSIISSSPSPKQDNHRQIIYNRRFDNSNSYRENSEMSPFDSLDTTKKHTQYADLLTPQQGNYKVYNYETRMKQIRDRIPCPLHINKDLHDLQVQQFRMSQIFYQGEDDETDSWFFDFQLQRLTKADTSCSFMNYDMNNLSESGYQTVLLYQDRYTQYSASDLQEIFKLNLQRELFFTGLYKSGFLNSVQQLHLQPQYFWNKYANYIISNKIYLFTQSIINYLLVTKIQVNVYICTYNYKEQFPYLREFLHTTLLHLLKLMGFEKSLFDQNERLLLSPNLWKIQHNFFQKLETHMYNQGYQDYSNIINKLQIQETPVFLPKSDGTTITYADMQGIQQLNMYDPAWIINNVSIQILKQSIPIQSLTYYSHQTSIQNVQKELQECKTSQQLQQQFYNVKYLFQNVYLRQILHSDKLYDIEHSKIYFLILMLIQSQYNKTTQTNIESQDITQCISDTITQTIKAGVEYIAEYCDNIEQILILVEIFENTGIPISEKLYLYYYKLLNKNMVEINNNNLLINQLYGLGVL